MAIKKKVDDTPLNKKARAALMRKSKNEAFQASGELNRIQSLAGGDYARILDTRKDYSHHVRVGSSAYDTLVTELLESSHGDRIRTELVDLGFPLPVTENLCPDVLLGVPEAL